MGGKALRMVSSRGKVLLSMGVENIRIMTWKKGKTSQVSQMWRKLMEVGHVLIFLAQRKKKAKFLNPNRKLLSLNCQEGRQDFEAWNVNYINYGSRSNNGDNYQTNEFYLVKFNAYSNYEFALARGPWLIFDHYLIVRPRILILIQMTLKLTKVTAWIRILGLPIKVLDNKFLTFLGNCIRKTLKVYATTLEQAKGKYA